MSGLNFHDVYVSLYKIEYGICQKELFEAFDRIHESSINRPTQRKQPSIEWNIEHRHYKTGILKDNQYKNQVNLVTCSNFIKRIKNQTKGKVVFDLFIKISVKFNKA